MPHKDEQLAETKTLKQVLTPDNVWAAFAIHAVIGCCLISGATPLVFGISLVGIFFVLAVNFKMPSSQLLGAVFCAMLAWFSFQSGFIANAVINLVLVVPSIRGYFVWKRGGSTPQIKQLTRKQALLLVLAVLISSSIAIWFSISAGASLPFADGLTAVLPVVATALMTLAYKEQWIVWNILNAVQVYMWIVAASLNPALASIAVMKIIFLANSIFGMYNWYNSEQKSEPNSK